MRMLNGPAGGAGLLLGLLLSLTACSSRHLAPVANQASRRPATPAPVTSATGAYTAGKPGAHSEYHIVAKGDTLYSIAWRYGHDYRDVAVWNGIAAPFLIKPGQVIRLKPEPNAINATKPAAAKPQRPAVTAAPNVQRGKPGAAVASHEPVWQWPTRGKLIKGSTPTAKKGINIVGNAGQSIKSAAAGEVVYSGSGLLGYGRLIIIKHNERFLSAYAHNDKLHVKEGDTVHPGQEIATMGLGNDGQPVLHFEIRKDGKPVDPLMHLPKRS